MGNTPAGYEAWREQARIAAERDPAIRAHKAQVRVEALPSMRELTADGPDEITEYIAHQLNDLYDMDVERYGHVAAWNVDLFR